MNNGEMATKAADGDWYDAAGKNSNGKIKSTLSKGLDMAKGIWGNLKSAPESANSFDSANNKSGNHNNTHDQHKPNDGFNKQSSNHGNSFNSDIDNSTTPKGGSQGVGEKILKYGGRTLGAAGTAYEVYESGTKAIDRHKKGDDTGAALEVAKGGGVIAGAYVFTKGSPLP